MKEVVLTREGYEKLKQEIEVLSTDAGSQKDFVAWCRQTGNELLEQTTDGPVHRFVIRRK